MSGATAARPPLESTVEKDIVADAEADGWLSYKIMRANKRGLPDRLFIRQEGRRTRYVWLEIKRPGRPAGAQQRLRHVELRAQGAEVHVVDNRAAAKLALA